MTNEQKQAYDWALHQNYQSVAAKNAKTLAELVRKILSVKSGDPLTLDQLREKTNEPVYLYIYDTALDSGWHILKAVTEDKIIFRGWNTVYVPISSIGKCFDLYAYPPAHIDREAWKPLYMGRWDEED